MRSLKGGAQGGRDPLRFGPGGAISRGGGEIPGTPVQNNLASDSKLFKNTKRLVILNPQE